MKTTDCLGVAVLSVLVFPSVVSACTAIVGTPVTWVRDSEVIIRVRALEERVREESAQQSRDIARSIDPQFDTKIRFRVLEVLKGDNIGGFVEFDGKFTERDDRNDGPIPYTFVRVQGRAGNCFAYTYKQGREYLLILGIRSGTLSPYWAPLAATNEQLSGDNDPWLAWVRTEVRKTQH